MPGGSGGRNFREEGGRREFDILMIPFIVETLFFSPDLST